VAEVSSVNSVKPVQETWKTGEADSESKRADAMSAGNTQEETKDSYVPATSSDETDDYTKKINNTDAKKPAVKEDKKEDSDNESGEITGKKELTDKEKNLVKKLAKIDDETRAHEAAHMAAGSGLVRGGASYTYEKGPDGKSYAVGGEVHIDISPEKDPEDTVLKMNRVRAAALAPADPSSTDRQVASKAAQIQAQARMEMSSQQSTNSSVVAGNSSSADTAAVSVTAQTVKSDENSSNKLMNEQATKTYNKNRNSEDEGLGANVDFTVSVPEFSSLKGTQHNSNS